METREQLPKAGASSELFAQGDGNRISTSHCREFRTGGNKNRDDGFNINPSQDALVSVQQRHGQSQYQRQRDLPGLLHLFPGEIQTLDQTGSDSILRKLVLALKAERRRGRAGHWRYSLRRHMALMQAVSAEKLRLRGS